MRFRTCRESMLNSFKKSRDISGPIQVITKDELLEKKPILNKLCFLKLNINELSKVVKLANLYLIENVFMASKKNEDNLEELPTKRICLLLRNISSKATIVVGVNQIILLDSNLVEIEWFRRAVERVYAFKNKDISLVSFRERMRKIVNRESIELPTNVIHSTKFKNILYVDISKKEIEEIDPMKYKVKTIRSKLIVFDKRSKEVVKSYRIVKLTGDLDSIQDVTYRRLKQFNKYKDYKTLSEFYNSYFNINKKK